MTNEEAIKILQHVFHYYDEHSQEINWDDLNEACGMAIEALKDKGYNAGYQEGFEAGILKGSQTILNSMKNAVQIVPDQLQGWRLEE